jgi:predicted MFS family arabinose efflux permease
MLVDRWKRVPIFIFGALLMWITSTAFAFIDHVSPLLYLLRMLQGAAFACCFTAATTLAADLAPPDRRAQGLGIFGVFTLITHGLAVIMAEFIESRIGFTGVFYIVPLWSLVALALFLGVPETRHGHAQGTHTPLVKLLLAPSIFPVLVVSVLTGCGFGVVLTFVPVLAETIGIEHVSIFFASYVVSAVAVRLVGGRLADIHGRRAIALPSLAILVVSIAGLAVVAGPVTLALAGLAFGVGHGLLYPALNALMVDVCRREDRGKAMSLYNAAFNLGITGGMSVFGRVAEAYGYASMFTSAALVVLIGLIVFWQRIERGT